MEAATFGHLGTYWLSMDHILSSGDLNHVGFLTPCTRIWQSVGIRPVLSVGYSSINSHGNYIFVFNILTNYRYYKSPAGESHVSWVELWPLCYVQCNLPN